MKKQSLSISVPEPCHEKWSKMSPVEKGRHCLSCQKTVVDFTKMPKVKIAEFVSEQEGNICGRFTSDQLNVELIPQKPKRSWFKYAAILLGLIPTMTYGQKVKDTQVIVQNHEPTDVKEKLYQGKHISQTGNKKLLKGIVVDGKSGEAILFGTVAVYDSKGVVITGVETDLEGRFEIEVPEGGKIEASYIGYAAKSIKYKKLSFDKTFEIKLKEKKLQACEMVLGMMVSHVKEPSKEIKNVNLEPIEITEYKAGEISVDNTYSLITGAVGVYHKPNENWFKRQWMQFKALVSASHKEAIKNELNSKFVNNRDEHETDFQDARPIENIEVRDRQVAQLFKVYPNPVTEIINIELPDFMTECTVHISDMKNELVLTQKIESHQPSINVSNLNSGSYVVSILSNEELVHSEVIIKQ